MRRNNNVIQIAGETSAILFVSWRVECDTNGSLDFRFWFHVWWKQSCVFNLWLLGLNFLYICTPVPRYSSITFRNLTFHINNRKHHRTYYISFSRLSECMHTFVTPAGFEPMTLVLLALRFKLSISPLMAVQGVWTVTQIFLNQLNQYILKHHSQPDSHSIHPKWYPIFYVVHYLGNRMSFGAYLLVTHSWP